MAPPPTSIVDRMMRQLRQIVLRIVFLYLQLFEIVLRIVFLYLQLFEIVLRIGYFKLKIGILCPFHQYKARHFSTLAY